MTMLASLLLAPMLAAPGATPALPLPVLQDSSASVTRDGATLPTRTDVDGHTLVLNGTATRKKFIVKVYVAALYLPARETDAERILGADMEDVKKGDQLVLTYLPGLGTSVSVKGVAKGTMEGKAFADDLFKVWIGPRPGPGEGIKKQLLGL